MSADMSNATAPSDRKTEINKRVQARYDELREAGKHGHYETMFQIVHEMMASERAELLAALREKETVIAEFLECAQYDALMEGPAFKSWNRSALDRLRKKLEARAALAKAEERR